MNTVDDATSSNDSVETLARETLHKFLCLNRYLRQYARQINSQGLRPRQFSVLRFLLESGSATVGQVQAYLYRSPSTASTMITHLEKAGFVTRTRSETDNRVVIVKLTAAGREIAQNTPLGGIPLLRRRLDKLPAERLQRLNEALVDLMDLMEVTDIE